MSKKNLTILYITYISMENVTSGSSVRPVKLLKAMYEEGYNVVLLNGEQIKEKKVRKQRIRKLLKEIHINRPDLCYIESSTYPIMLHADRQLIRKIHHLNIPIGYFYRDFYLRFPRQFPRGKGIIRWVKNMTLQYLQYLTDYTLKFCDIVYFPSIEATKLFNYRDMRVLLPAGNNCLPMRKIINYTGIYVGGITEQYGGALLLDIFEELYKKNSKYHLILVCREEEWNVFRHHCKKAKWLEVHHVSGEDLGILYSRASVAISCKEKTVYNDLAISVKTFEYMSYGLPQVVVNSKAIQKIILDEKIGMAVEPQKDAFVNAIEYLLNNSDVYSEYQKNIRNALLKRHLWNHRIQQIVSELNSKYKNYSVNFK